MNGVRMEAGQGGGAAPAAPAVADPGAWDRFRTLAGGMGLDPDDRWVGGYVPYEWSHGRHFFESYAGDLNRRQVLEFGCNVGASGIVLARLGAQVTGVEVDPAFASLAQAHADAYAVGDRMRVLCVEDTRRMPLPDRSFDLIVCNSVLEYVASDLLAAVQAELLRVLAPAGLILVMGTSNRLWPREVHSGGFANYLPRALDRLLGGRPRQRGVSPFTVRHGFPGCASVDREDGGRSYLRARERMGTGAAVLSAMRVASLALRPFGLTVGMLMPSFSMALRRNAK